VNMATFLQFGTEDEAMEWASGLAERCWWVEVLWVKGWYWVSLDDVRIRIPRGLLLARWVGNVQLAVNKNKVR